MVVIYPHRIVFVFAFFFFPKSGIPSILFSKESELPRKTEWLAKYFTSEKSITHTFLNIIQQAVNRTIQLFKMSNFKQELKTQQLVLSGRVLFINVEGANSGNILPFTLHLFLQSPSFTLTNLACEGYKNTSTSAALGFLLPYVLFSQSTWLTFCIPKIQRCTVIPQAAKKGTNTL